MEAEAKNVLVGQFFEGLKLNSIIVQIEFYENSLFEVVELSETLSIFVETIGFRYRVARTNPNMRCDALPVQ